MALNRRPEQVRKSSGYFAACRIQSPKPEFTIGIDDHGRGARSEIARTTLIPLSSSCQDQEEEGTIKLSTNSSRGLKGYAGANTRRRVQEPIVVHQKPGPLQTIFDLLPDEIVEHSYSCAMERSFLYHGRIVTAPSTSKRQLSRPWSSARDNMAANLQDEVDAQVVSM
nr:BAG-associated GRAM protein 1 isoform X1 [Tanacetum cinerariifolium]